MFDNPIDPPSAPNFFSVSWWGVESFLMIPTQDIMELGSDHSFHYICYGLSHKIPISKGNKNMFERVTSPEGIILPHKLQDICFYYKIAVGLYENLSSTIIHVNVIVYRLASEVQEFF